MSVPYAMDYADTTFTLIVYNFYEGSLDSLHLRRNCLLKYVINLMAPELFSLILAHPVYKMWIIQEPNTLELWNKLHFEKKKTERIYHV